MSDEKETTTSFESALEKLEAIVDRLEKGELSLEESLRLYEEGISLSRLCHSRLEEAEGRIELLIKNARGDVATDADGEPRGRPFEPAGEPGRGPRR